MTNGNTAILVDTNLLVYASVDSPHHERTREWLRTAFSDRESFVGLTWPVLYSFVRLVTNRRIVGDHAVNLSHAWSAAEQFRRQPNARILQSGARHPAIARRLISTPGLASNDVLDVHLAAMAIEHGVSLATHDHGFARFQGLDWFDPLAT